MSGNATTRAARTAAGLCAVCLAAKARRHHPTCGPCAVASLAGDRARYARRRSRGGALSAQQIGEALAMGRKERVVAEQRITAPAVRRGLLSVNDATNTDG